MASCPLICKLSCVIWITCIQIQIHNNRQKKTKFKVAALEIVRVRPCCLISYFIMLLLHFYT